MIGVIHNVTGEVENLLRHLSARNIPAKQYLSVAAARGEDLDVLVLNLDLRDAVDYMQELSPTTARVVAMSAEPDPQARERLLRLCVTHADFFFDVPLNLDDVIPAVESLATQYHYGVWGLDLTNRQVYLGVKGGESVEQMRKKEPIKLTNTEFRLLAKMLMEAPRACDYSDLAQYVYGEKMSNDAALGRLKTHVHNLHTRLQEATGFQTIGKRAGEVFWVNEM